MAISLTEGTWEQEIATSLRSRNDKKDSVTTLDRSIPLLNALSQNNLRGESRVGCERFGLAPGESIFWRLARSTPVVRRSCQ